jgi:pimeloyl-ACP methyl ester carboxylesterase
VSSPATATGQQLAAAFAAFWTRFPYRRLEVEGVEWRYVDTGTDGPAVLMLPGGSYRPDNYFQLIADLADDFRIIAPAYPPVFPLRSVLRGVGAVLDAAGLQQATVFAGLPTMRVVAALFTALPLRLIRAFTWRLWMRWFTAPPESERFWRARLRTELAEMTRAEHLAGVRNIVDFMATCSPAPGWLAPWDGRVLILEATDDQAFPAGQRAELRRAYPQATVRALDAGHTALFTHPELFTTEIRGFLRVDRAGR